MNTSSQNNSAQNSEQTNTDQTEQPTSAVNNYPIDFSHRLSDPSLNSSLALIDNIGSMADRANGILSVLFWHLQNPDAGPLMGLCVCPLTRQSKRLRT
jgi:hypothetical protein